MSERFYEVVYTGSSKSRYGAMQRVIGIKCPWCESVTEAYAWSLAGSGKRCSNCTAVHRYLPQVSTRAES